MPVNSRQQRIKVCLTLCAFLSILILLPGWISWRLNLFSDTEEVKENQASEEVAPSFSLLLGLRCSSLRITFLGISLSLLPITILMRCNRYGL